LNLSLKRFARLVGKTLLFNGVKRADNEDGRDEKDKSPRLSSNEHSCLLEHQGIAKVLRLDQFSEGMCTSVFS